MGHGEYVCCRSKRRTHPHSRTSRQKAKFLNRTFSRESPTPFKGNPWCKHQRKYKYFPESVGDKSPRANQRVLHHSHTGAFATLKENASVFRTRWFQVNPYGDTTQQKRQAYLLVFLLVTRTGLEPMLPPWKGGVLTAWPTGLLYFSRLLTNRPIFPPPFCERVVLGQSKVNFVLGHAQCYLSHFA